jgi:NTE family protein
MSVVKNNIKIGYALGGGAARGLSHIGVLKVLHEHGISPDIIVGTSIGAIIGALYAGGLDPDDIEKLVLGLDWKRLVYLFDMTLPLNGLLQGKPVVSLLRSILGDLTFPQLRCDFACVATDIVNGEQVVLSDGSLVEAVRASISIPGILTPVAIKGRYLVDGGLINAVPVSVCREMGAGYVVGVNVVPEPSKVMCNPNQNQQYQVCEPPELGDTVDKTELATVKIIHSHSLRTHIDEIENAAMRFFIPLSPNGENRLLKTLSLPKEKKVRRSRTKSPSLIDVLSQTLTIVEYRIAVENLKGADLAISPDVENIGFWQFHNAGQAIAAGEHAARKALEENKLAILLGKS